MVLMNPFAEQQWNADIEKKLWTHCGKERVGQMEKVAWKHINYHMQNR